MAVTETDKRQQIIGKLAMLLPEAMQPLGMLFAEKAISNIPDSELDNLLSDVNTVPDAIENQNTDYLFELCRKYGASEEQIEQVASGGMPLFPSSIFG